MSDDYLPDSDDSHDEDERPNRWAGPPSTWQQLNSTEIDTLTALNDIRNRDLSVHLYNAFALKKRHDAQVPTSEKGVDVGTRQLVQEDKWRPPKSWTAWPMAAHDVPRPEFLTRTIGPDDAFTFRKREPDLPSLDLEDAVAATILRFAKEKFEARPVPVQVTDPPGVSDSDEDPDQIITGSSAASHKDHKARLKSRLRSVKDESTSEGERMDVDTPSIKNQLSTAKRINGLPLLKPVVATDDELSYEILRPTVRHILSQLDRTLTVLHHAQESTVNYQSDSADSDASDASSLSLNRERSMSRNRSLSRSGRGRRPRLRATSQIRRSEAAKGQKKRVGRPKKEYPRLDGETDREYTIRVARLQKKPIPFLPPDSDVEPWSVESTPAPEPGVEQHKEKTKGERWKEEKEMSRPALAKSRLQQQRQKPRRRNSSKASSRASSTSSERSNSTNKHPRRQRLGLRNWRDVLGAAALAGFPAAALDRAARRCADLFGESFALHTLQEGPLEETSGGSLNRRVQYDPGMIVPAILDLEDYEGDEVADEEEQDRSTRLSRAPSAAPSTEQDQDQRHHRDRQTQSRARSRSRSRSASAGGAFFCIYASCPRALEPFDRRHNLLRHLKLVHHYEGDELPVEVDSEDEMAGAVHVDGFLKPIKVRQGWRGNDEEKGARVRPSRGRSAGRGEVMGGDEVMRDGSSEVGEDENEDSE
ncbi:RNA polymerase I-specific transcription initiation factor-domain-containing protein [Xylariaceae sp. FL0255]|nr:RNA polymerase I-specific transcription initiation factor-domain-containing protein [Xylariaceae sp. FL0255]